LVHYLRQRPHTRLIRGIYFFDIWPRKPEFRYIVRSIMLFRLGMSYYCSDNLFRNSCIYTKLKKGYSVKNHKPYDPIGFWENRSTLRLHLHIDCFQIRSWRTYHESIISCIFYTHSRLDTSELKFCVLQYLRKSVWVEILRKFQILFKTKVHGWHWTFQRAGIACIVWTGQRFFN
jgi:hypothetical protein